jgi:hypothetical protein
MNGRTYALRPSPGASPTGKFAKSPMRKLERAAMAAVVVMRFCRTSLMQERYSWSLMHRSAVGQTQGPPESDRMDALTDICGGEMSLRFLKAGEELTM